MYTCSNGLVQRESNRQQCQQATPTTPASQPVFFLLHFFSLLVHYCFFIAMPPCIKAWPKPWPRPWFMTNHQERLPQQWVITLPIQIQRQPIYFQIHSFALLHCKLLLVFLLQFLPGLVKSANSFTTVQNVHGNLVLVDRGRLGI